MLCNETRRLVASDPALDDFFGLSVALNGMTAVIGAPGESDDTGKVYHFENLSTCAIAGIVCTETQQLTASDAAFGNRFGVSVSLSGTAAIIGGAVINDGDFEGSGSAYYFECLGAGCTEIVKLAGSDAGDPGDIDAFGLWVGVSGTTAVVGAPGDDDSGVNSGAAYIFELAPAARIANFLDGMDANLPQGIKKSIESKLASAILAFENDDDRVAINELGALINFLEAQSGKKITEDDAKSLIKDAQAIIDLIGGGA